MLKELVAPEGSYLSQATLDNEESRIFVRAIFGENADETKWIIASQSEKDAWEETYAPKPEELGEL